MIDTFGLKNRGDQYTGPDDSLHAVCRSTLRSRGVVGSLRACVCRRNLSVGLAPHGACNLEPFGLNLLNGSRVGREFRAKETQASSARFTVTPFLPILPVLLLALVCTIGCFWSMRAIDRFLSDNPHQTDHPSAGTDSPVRVPR